MNTLTVMEKSQLSMLDSFIKFLRLLALVGLMGVFAYWTYGAIAKYLSEPVSTRIAFKFGDDNVGNIAMPVVTFCNQHFKDISCNGERAQNFLPFADKCIDALNSTEEFVKMVSYENVVEGDINMKDYSLEHVQDQVWQSFVHPEFGFCYTLDVALLPEYEMVAISDIFGNPGFVFKVKNGSHRTHFEVLIHSRYDLSEAHILNPGIDMASHGFHYDVSLGKRVIQTISTEANPCQKYAKKSCLQRNQYKAIMELVGCEIIYFKDGSYLDDLRPLHPVTCNAAQHKLATEALREEGGMESFLAGCVSKQGCTQAKFSIQVSVTPKPQNETSSLDLTYVDPIVEYSIDEISYDLQSLIGEVGGTLGLTINLSFLSIVQYCIYFAFEKAQGLCKTH